jgi:DNA-binding transcriptional regulator/RsmH inhibitor MraZ
MYNNTHQRGIIMFGESSIYGKSIIHLDDKNRIILPKFTSAEKGDKLLLVRNKGYISIHKQDILDSKIRKLEELCFNSTGDIKIEREKELFELYNSITKKMICDSQGRVGLGDIIDTREIECVGAREYLILKPQKK